jgi:hypothetical protein
VDLAEHFGFGGGEGRRGGGAGGEEVAQDEGVFAELVKRMLLRTLLELAEKLSG